MHNVIDKFKSLFANNNKKKKLFSYSLVICAYIIIEAMIRTGSLSATMTALLIPTCAYIVAALALNLVVGYLGDLCLGQAGFMVVGAFSGVIAASYFGSFISNDILVFIIAIIFGGLFACLAGFIVGVPVLKLQGDYLAIVTLAFCQIIISLLLNLYCGIDAEGLHFSFINDNVSLLDGGYMIVKGALGVSVKHKLSTFTSGIILILITLFIIYELMNSKSGRAILATRDNKIAAKSLGISTTKYKLLAFVLAAFIAGMAGAYYGLGYSSFKAAKFDFNLSILILVYVVLGGLGNMTGTIISTSLLIVLPEMLRKFNDYRMVIYAIILILVMLVTNNTTLMSYLSAFKDKIKALFNRKEKRDNV